MSNSLEQQLRRLSVYQPDDIDEIIHNESNHYRFHLAVVINFLRVMALISYFLVVYPLSHSRGDFSFTNENLIYSPFTPTIFVYLIVLVGIGVLIKYYYYHAWLLLINALLDALLLFTMVSMAHTQQGWTGGNPMPPLFIVSIMASVLTLSAVQSSIFGAFNGVLFLLFIIASEFGLNGQHSPILLGTTNGFSNWQLILDLPVQVLVYVFCLSVLMGGAIALLGYFSARAQENKISAKINQYFINKLYKVNASIIEEISSGLLVVNAQGLIVSLNRQAKLFLNLASEAQENGLQLLEVSPVLNRRFHKWLHLQNDEFTNIDLASGEYSLNFVALDRSPEPELILIMLENAEVYQERVRETRLASLGRLSAGIAHEIRNPLSAIQQAGDLLAEYCEPDTVCYMLVEKIQRNTKRINGIVYEVMRLFDNSPSQPELIQLNAFVRQLVIEVSDYNDFKDVSITINLNTSDDLSVLFSVAALREILTNLLLNAKKHNSKIALQLQISTRLSENKQNVYLDVSDNGAGVPLEEQEKIFEPFYSLRNSTGLGLYLVREMCSANHARILLVRRTVGACFRIIMRHYPSNIDTKKMQNH